MAEINQLLNNLLTVAQGIGAAACAWFLCLAGWYFMTSGGNPQKIEQSKSAAFNALVGFGVILSARVIAGIVRQIVPGA